MADGSRMQRRVLHTSDLHLKSLDDRECSNFEVLVNRAINKIKPDLIIIAGDLFDYTGVSDNVVSFVVEQLQRLSVPTFILPGNHDCLVPHSVYQRLDLWEHATNVHIFRTLGGETIAPPGLGVTIWGKPIDSYGGNLRPLAGIPQRRQKGQWHIAVAHGYYVGTESDSYYSFQISQEEIVASGQDYIALGHKTLFDCVCSEPAKAYYCGSLGLFGTIAIVELNEETGIQVTPYSI